MTLATMLILLVVVAALFLLVMAPKVPARRNLSTGHLHRAARRTTRSEVRLPRAARHRAR